METKDYEPSRVLFVRNLPASTTKEELTELFQKYGKVENTLVLL